MTTDIEYALMAGASYISNRPEINQFPVPDGWVKVVNPDSYFNDPISGFEAISFTKGTEIVISYAGTDFSQPGSDFLYGNIPLAGGILSDQLRQAADYYLQVKALNPEATITFTGHSLGGGLASLMAVLFGESAFTFNQAPFRNAARTYSEIDENGDTIPRSVSRDLRAYLTGTAAESLLAPLDAYIAATDPTNPTPNPANTLAAREATVTNINVQGEVLSPLPLSRIGSQADILQQNNMLFGMSDLHSQALLTAFLQSDQTAATGRALNDVTFKLPDLLKMIFDDKLFNNNPLSKDNPQRNFLEHLVRHEAGVRDPATGTATLPADAMVTRFTADLWKLAQPGGLTMRDNNPTNADVHDLSQALIAFAMQKYYEETAGSAGYNKELFTDLTTAGTGSNGIQFDMADVSAAFKTAFDNNQKPTLKDAKGFDLYFKHYLGTTNNFTPEERQLIQSLLPYLRDWYVQAGTSGMIATDTLNRGAFMLGGSDFVLCSKGRLHAVNEANDGNIFKRKAA